MTQNNQFRKPEPNMENTFLDIQSDQHKTINY
jgi:hypothetical protein